MASSNATCPVCGGNKFEEENGLYYCTVCNTRLEGMVIISHEEAPPQTQFGVKIGTLPEKTAKKTDTGYLWSTYEGFNLILVAQTKFLIGHLGLPDDIRRVVLALWANYLEKVQVAFVKDNVKLSFRSRKRDIEAFVKNTKSIRAVRYAGKKKKSTLNHDIKSKRVFDADELKLQQETFPKTLRKLEDYKKTGRENVLRCLAFSDGPIDPKSLCLPTIEEENDEDEERRKAKEDAMFEPEVILSFDDEDDDDDSGVVDAGFQLPESHLNDYSRTIHTLVSDGKLSQPQKTQSNNVSLLSIDKMTMPYTLSFMLIAFRILKLNIHMCDILNWVDQGYFPYYNASHFLPDSWSQFQFDSRLFSPIFSPSVETLAKKTSDLCKFLKLFPLPKVELKDLMIKMLFELNLPLDLHLIVFNNDYLLSKFKSLMIYNQNRVQALPVFEVHVLMFILIILRKFYYIDDQDQLLYQCSESNHFKKTKSPFEPHLWVEYTRIRVRALRLYYTPLWNETTSQEKDVEVAFEFYRQFAWGWRPKVIQNLSRHFRYNDGPFRDKMKQLVCSGTIKSDSKIKFPPPSFTFLSDATKFVAERAQDDVWRQLLKVNFRRKSISYLGQGKRFLLKYEPIARKDAISGFVWDYLQLVSWMVHLEKSKLLECLRSVEKHFFKDH